MSEQATITRMGYITFVNRVMDHHYIQIDGVELEGIIIHIDDQTVITDRQGVPISFDCLHEEMIVEIEHRLGMTMSLPPQTYAYAVRIIEG